MLVLRGLPRLNRSSEAAALAPEGRAAPPATAVCIGNFDGVHRGHRALLEQLTEAACARGLASTVLTFSPHPREYFASLGLGEAPARIATLRDRLVGLAACAVDQTCVLHFNQRLAALEADQFIARLLIAGLNTRYLIVGDDFRFGARRQGDYALLRRHAQSGAFELARIDTLTDGGARVSSSLVRAALGAGDLARARDLLGHDYRISGHVIHGKKLGRGLGFPTANLAFRDGRPALAGVFVVRVFGVDDRPRPAVASLGTRPAVEVNGHWLLEVHLLDTNIDLYGRLLCVDFLAKLRDEAHFESLAALRAQIANDVTAARDWFATKHRGGTVR